MGSSSSEATSTRHTCLKLQLGDDESSSSSSSRIIFVKGIWYPTHFSLSITDGLQAWLCNASEEDVRERASQWDQSVSEYIAFAESFLGFQQPLSIYRFTDAGNGHRRLSWTFHKQGIQLEWRWRCIPSPDSRLTTCDILNFLMDANIRLSYEVVKKNELCDRFKQEAHKCLLQSEKLSLDKLDFESQLYAKFVNVLNTKKAKLRALRDRLSKVESKGKQPKEDEVSTDGTEPYHSDTDDGANSGAKSD